jgi:hypothetical protein
VICRLKCLVIIEFFYLDQPRFLLGNFERFLRDTQTRFELVVASGVLYHLMDPLLSLLDMMRVTGHIFVWSHFFNDVVMPVNDARRSFFTHETIAREQNGSHLTNHVASSSAFCSKPSLCHCSKLHHLRWIYDRLARGARDTQEALA